MLQPITATQLGRLPAVKHGFFTRQGGVSAGVYSSLNCGLGSGDDRSCIEENRRRVAAHFDVASNKMLTAHQIHSATAVIVDRPWAADAQPKADALVTRTRGLALGALAADCAPILFADAKAGVVAAAHAGWKGALAGIIEATVVAMEQAGARRGDISAAVGPCIGPEAYEVGLEFQASFVASHAQCAAFFAQPAGRERPYFDLPGFVIHQLHAAHLGQVESATVCTYAHPELFFSYRRMSHVGEADYGRQISAIVLA